MSVHIRKSKHDFTVRHLMFTVLIMPVSSRQKTFELCRKKQNKYYYNYYLLIYWSFKYTNDII